MRGLKSFLMSGITLCMLYLIVQSTFFTSDLVDDGTGTMNRLVQKLYSTFNITTQADAEGAEAEAAPAEEEHPAEAPAPEPAAEEHPAEAAPAEEKKEEAPAPAEAKPAAEEPKKEEEKKPAEGEKKEEKPAEQPKPEEGQEELVGFDTIDLAEPSGNWVYKRIWWERAQNRYEQIKGEFDKILESRMPFFKRRAEIDRKILEPLYVSAGLDREEITKILAEFNTLLTVDQEKHAALDEREKKMQIAAMEDKKILEQLQEDIKQLSKYEDVLDSFLDKLMEQVNTARTYEKQSWQAYKEIGTVLNDKKARELYEGMNTPFKRLSDITQYINGVFKQEFDKVDSTVQEHATRIKNTLQSLREKGLDFKKYSKQLDEKMRQEDLEKEQKEAAPEEAVEEGGIMATITSWWNMVVDTFSSLYDSIMSYFTGSSDTAEAEATPAEAEATPAEAEATPAETEPQKAVEPKTEKEAAEPEASNA